MYKKGLFVLIFLFGGASMAADRYINIVTPVEQDIVDPSQPLLVSGTGRGIFEGNVVVRIEDVAGKQLVQVPTTMKRDDIAAEGEWQISITLPASLPGTILLSAFSPSPKEGDLAITSRSIMLTVQTATDSEGQDWKLGRYRNESGEMTGVIADTTVTARFQDGKVSGHAGCNSFNASYEITGDQITMGPAMTTRMHCAEPDGIMEQEQEYLQALSRVRVVELTDSGLKLRDEKGALQVNFVVGEKGRQ